MSQTWHLNINIDTETVHHKECQGCRRRDSILIRWRQKSHKTLHIHWKKGLVKTVTKLPFRIRILYPILVISLQGKLEAKRCLCHFCLPPSSATCSLMKFQIRLRTQGYEVFWIHLYKYMSGNGLKKRHMGMYSLWWPVSNLLEMRCKLTSVKLRFGKRLLY